MNREICAYLLLLALFLGSLYNIHVMDTKIGSLRTEAEKAYESAQNGDFEDAYRQLRSAADRWLDMDEYTHIFIRHTEIDSATDAFFDMLSDIASKDAESAEGSYRKLDAHLQSLITIEHLSFGSIF